MENLFELQTVLIVDDSKANIAVLAEVLRQDYKVRAATGGEKALEIAFSDNPPDLILLDVVMPDMSGYEVCSRLKADPQTKSIPVIFITGKESEEDEIKGFEMGASDYITKPFNPVIVKARVNTQAELKRNRDYMERISYLDGLTGIANRRKFNEFLDLSWNFSKRQSIPIALIMMDIDFFKAYNDSCGHLEGDACLIQIAQALAKTAVRKTDLVARYGGEEFACVLPGTSLENAVIVAEKLRQSVMALQIPHHHSAAGSVVTISLGIAAMVPEKSAPFSLLIQSADDALYQSKESGRNKVSTAPPQKLS
jgi:diguanylate cyclase (GGDEF)-like protein